MSDLKLNKWLKNRVDDQNRFQNKHNGLHHSNDFYKYYTDNDLDVINSDTITAEAIVLNAKYCNSVENNKYTEACENYGNKNILIEPGTNQSHTNYLFKRLIDKSSKMTKEVANVNNRKYIGHDIIDIITPEMKEGFYKFCHENST
jgi:hypothetical protein